jgi:phosphopantothenoylcysteine decarboxylase/phosphopantothenate--cysteine ligase
MNTDWDFSKPDVSNLGDHDVFADRDNLKDKRVALVLTGGIAAIKAPFIARLLRRYGADVVVYATENALKFVTVDSLEWCTTNKVITELTPASEHLSDDKPFDAYLVAPATANIISKMAVGIADDPVSTTLASAIGRMEEGRSKVLVAPTMHHTLHTSILSKALRTLSSVGVRIIPPREQNGKHNIPHDKVLVSEVCRAVSDSPLKGKKILVTGGPTPTPIDNVRRITNRFRGRLGICIAEELYLRGADMLLVHGDGAFPVPKHIPHVVARTFTDYKRIVGHTLAENDYKIGIFSAAVADFEVGEVHTGTGEIEFWRAKIPSGQDLTLKLTPTEKIIDMVKDGYPDLFMMTFKYQENIELDKLIEIAEDRLNKGHNAVVANRGEETNSNGEQVAYLVSKEEGITRLATKKTIAKGIVDYLEKNGDQ